MRIVEEMITPDRAKNYLKKNIDKNRPITQGRVDGYASDMLNNRWLDTGDPIKFNTKDQMFDGQHRLLAIILADVPVSMHVAYDVSEEAFPVIDTGRSRTFGNALGFEGISDPNRVAGVVKGYLMWKKGAPTNKAMTAPTPAMLYAGFHKDPTNFVEAARRSNDLKRAGVTQSIMSGVAYYLFNRISPSLTHTFFDQLVTGANLNERSPILVLRNRLMAHSEHRYTPGEVLALFVRAWNAYIEDRTVRVLYANGTDKKPLTNYNFPAIKTPKEFIDPS